MSLEIVAVGPELEGRRLGQKLFSSKGSLLLGQGTEISPFHQAHIKEAGYRSVYVLNGNGQPSVILDEPEHVITEKMRAKLPRQLKDIFTELSSNNKVVVSEGKKNLNQFTDILIKTVQRKLAEPPSLLDLKRQEDYLYQHAINVAAYSVLVGQRLRYHQMKLYDLALGALLSDFGMQLVDKEMLNRPEELTDAEYEDVKKHCLLGFQHLSRQCFMKGMVTIMAVQHHERIDGSGYPKGLRGDKIHEYSRIVAVADVFDAYTSDRPYRRLHTMDEALQHITEQAGRKLDKTMVEHFLAIFQ